MGIRQRLLDPPWTVPATAGADDLESENDGLPVPTAGEYAIFVLAPDGTVLTWNPTAQRLNGYREPDILGRHFEIFYPPEDVAAGKPKRELTGALRDGVFVDNGWRIRQDGSRFWAHVIITPLCDGPVLRGFAKVTRDDTAARAAIESGRAMADVARALLDGADVTDVLTTITAHASHLTAAGRAWLATPHDKGFTVRAADGRLPGPPVGARLPSDPVMTAVMRAGQPSLLADLRSCCPSLPNLEMLGAGLVVPMVARTGVLGILVAAAPSGTASFGSIDRELLQAFADQAALVLTYEHAQQALRKRHVGDERERIARDLHDHVIQQLFGTGIGLQSAAARIPDARTKIHIEEAVDHLDTTIRQIRTTIFDLHQGDLCSPETPRAQIAALVRDAARALPFAPILRFEGAIDTVVEQDTCEHLLAAVREMLSNVARHANASAATVSVSVGPEIAVTVTDNGGGPTAGAEAGSGLRNLHARATAMNGSFVFEAAPERGAIASLRIPLTPRSGDPLTPQVKSARRRAE